MDARSTLAALALLVGASLCHAQGNSHQTAADVGSRCRQIEDTIFYAPNDPSITEAIKNELRAEWQALGCKVPDDASSARPATPGVSTARSAILTWQDVKVYFRQPDTKYLELGLLEASSERSWTFSTQAKANKVMERLKVQAFNMGANGILLIGMGTEYEGTVNFGSVNATAYGNTAYGTAVGTSAVISHKAGSAIAIYVSDTRPTQPSTGQASSAPSPATSVVPTTPTPTTSKGRTNDIYDELTKLDELRKRGLITDEEFATQKQRVLSGK